MNFRYEDITEKIHEALENIPLNELKKRFEELIKPKTKDKPNHIILVCHRGADPDATVSELLCAFLLLLLAKDTLVKITMVTPGGIEFPQNVTMLRLAIENLIKDDSLLTFSDVMPKNYDHVILVDASSTKQANVGLDSVNPVIAIDPGHENSTEGKTFFVGGPARATTTILVLLYLWYAMEKEETQDPLSIQVDPILATLAHFGVHLDTNGTKSASTTDFDLWVWEWGFRNRDHETWKEIKFYPRPKSERIALGHALLYALRGDSCIVSSIGYASESDAEVLSSKAADWLLGQGGALYSLVMAIKQEEGHEPLLKVSLRSTTSTTESVKFLRQVLGTDTSAGGAQGESAGIISLGHRGKLIELALDMPCDDYRTESDHLHNLLIKYIKKLKEDNVPKSLKEIVQLFDITRQSVDENAQRVVFLSWFCTKRKQWLRERKDQEREQGTTIQRTPEEELAELFRVASTNHVVSSAANAMYFLLLKQYAYRAGDALGQTLFQIENS